MEKQLWPKVPDACFPTIKNPPSWRDANRGWLSNSLHPGVIDTKLLHAGFDMEGASVHSGAKTSVYLATSAKVNGISDKYFDDCKITPPLEAANDIRLAQQLWEWSEKAIGDAL